jgi:organic hydroperoxide reductase OsmC/OhrA
MKISARVTNQRGENTATVRTNDCDQSLAIAPRPEGFGSSVNGGELLFLALATCYCNDIYREARKRGIEVARVEVEVDGEFGGEGEPAQKISYRAYVDAKAPREAILDLMRHVDTVAEIQNTVRFGVPIVLKECAAHEV